MTERPIVVVGGGAAGHAAIEAYRDAGGDQPLLLVTKDDRLPYDRPALTKEYLRGELPPSGLALVEPNWYEDRGVDVRLGVEVTALDPAAGTLHAGGAVVAWSSCILATGSRPAPLPAPGGDDPGLFSIRSARDAERLIASVGERPGSVAVIGSGFIGCEAAASLRRRHLQVTVIAMEDLPQIERLGADVGDVLAGWLDDAGVRCFFGRQIHAVSRQAGRSWRIELAPGPGGLSTVDADHVLVATGAEPVVELAERAGLDIEGAVAVDAGMRTSAAEVFAVGDIAAAWHPVAGRRLRVEHWGDALAMGAVAGARLAGDAAAWRSAPGFWSTIGDHTIKHAAWGDGWDHVRFDRGPSSAAGAGFTAWYERDGEIVGVLTHERDADYDRGVALLEGSEPQP